MNRTLIGAALILSLSLAACSSSTPPVVTPDPITDPLPQADFAFSLTPGVVDVQANGAAELSATLQRSGGFTGAVTLTLLNPPAGMSAAAVTVPAGASAAKLTLKASNASVVGADTLTFAADAGSLHKTAPVKINVTAAPVQVGQPALTLVATPGSLTVKAGQPTTVEIKVTRSNLTGPVKLHLSNLPANVTAADVILDAGQDSGQMVLTQTGKTPAGSTTVQLQATSDAVKSSLNIPLTVESAESLPTAPMVSATSPASNAQAVNSAGLSVDVTFSQGMKSDVAKAISITPNVPNFFCAVDDGSVEIKQVNCTGSFQPNTNYKVTIATTAQNTSGVALAQPYTFSFKTAAQASPDPLPQSLALSSDHSSLSVTFGPPAFINIKVKRNNLSGPVKLHAANLPAKIEAPDIVIPADQDSATMTLVQGDFTAAGTTTIQIQASAGAVSAALNLPLTVETVTNPHKVLSTTPANGAQDFAAGPNSFEVKFSRVIREVEPTLNSVVVVPAVDKLNCFVKHDANNTPLDALQCTGTFAPSTTYTVTLTKELRADNFMPLQPYTFNFKTAPAIIIVPPIGDLTPPKVNSFTPTNGSIGVAHSPLSINVNFSEPMDKAATQKAFQLVVPNVTDSKKSFVWNAAGTVMTITYNEVLPYGTTVFWGMSNTATDLAGNHLVSASSVGGSYRLMRQDTIKLYSEKDLSFALRYNVEQKEIEPTGSSSSDYRIGCFTENFDGSGDRYYERAFFQFNMSVLPDYTKIAKINSAVLNIYIVERAFYTDNSPELLGDLDAVNISTPLIGQDVQLWNAPIANSGQTLRHIYQSPGPSTGYHSLNITVPFTHNFKNPGLSAFMSQWRIQREFDNYLSSKDFKFRVTTIGSQRESDINKRPYIQVTYEHP